MGRAHHKLADGRWKCKRCGGKDTRRPRYAKLSQEKQKETARLLWLRVAAAAAARAVGISANKQQPKVQSTYNRLTIDLQSTKGAPRRPSPGRAGPDQLHRYADGRRAHKKLSFNGFHHRRIKHDKTLVDGKVHINGLKSFQGDAKRRLKAAHAGFKLDFRRFIREGSFRFKHRDDENALDYPQDALLIWSAQVT